MELRKLNGNDIFKMSRILKKIDFKLDKLDLNEIIKTNLVNNDVDKIDDKDKKENKIEKIQISAGINVVKNVLENLYLAQDEVNDLLGGLVGCSGKEFGEKDLDEIIEVIAKFKEMIKGTSFFTTVSKLMK